jgi:hypothetical protein
MSRGGLWKSLALGALLFPAIGSAQTELPEGWSANALLRAKNLARQAAEARNGGLSAYRAHPSMHAPVAEAPWVESGDGAVRFVFCGGAPAEVIAGSYSKLTEVSVTVDGAATVVFNGPVPRGFDCDRPLAGD